MLCEKLWCYLVFWFKYQYGSTDLYTSVAQEHLNFDDLLPDINMIERDSNTGPLFLKDPCPIHCTTVTPY